LEEYPALQPVRLCAAYRSLWSVTMKCFINSRILNVAGFKPVYKTCTCTTICFIYLWYLWLSVAYKSIDGMSFIFAFQFWC
jgi:hypothetical protein